MNSNSSTFNLSSIWKDILSEQWNSDRMTNLLEFVESRYSETTVFPEKKHIFNIYNNIDPSEVKVVILGQDPYHGKGQAHGFSFSVLPGIAHPPSLRNIFKELYSDLESLPPGKTFGDLSQWVDQGVFLLNAVLTVEEGMPNSHKDKGWEEFTDATIKAISENNDHVAFVLWGNYAQKKSALIDTDKHLVIESAHPSPLSASRGFFGSQPFSKINNYLSQNNLKPIDWKIKDLCVGTLF